MNLRLKELYTLYSVQELAEHCLHEESENKILNNRINKALEYMNNYIELEDAPINERIKIEFKEVIKLLNGDDENE